MEPLLLGLQSQLEEIKGTLRELKAENAVLRNEILGIGNSAGTKAECVGVLEKKTLREFVEEIQFDLKSMKREMQNGNQGKSSVIQQLPSISDRIERTRGNDVKKHANFLREFRDRFYPQTRGDDSENTFRISHETQDEYPAIEIKQKTIKEERAWMKLKFDEERAKLPDATDGASLAGKTVESICSSIPRPRREPSCVLKLSNHMNSDLMDTQGWIYWNGNLISGLASSIAGHSCEVFSFQGNEVFIDFLLSFRVTKDLRLAVAFKSSRYSNITTVNFGFVPESIPTDRVMISDMERLESLPDICNGNVEGSTVEFFINHGNYFATARVSPGPRSIVYLDILEGVPPSLPPKVLIPCGPMNLDGFVEISNCLNVSLENLRRFTRRPELHESLPVEVLPFTRVAFDSPDNPDLEGMFAYKIASTDLSLAVAYGVQGDNSTFSAAFVPLPAETDERAFNLAMDPEQWKSHRYRKYAHAKDGEQEIQIRNIRARVSMTDGEKPQLKILIFTV